jgi:hypothetical protein
VSSTQSAAREHTEGCGDRQAQLHDGKEQEGEDESFWNVGRWPLGMGVVGLHCGAGLYLVHLYVPTLTLAESRRYVRGSCYSALQDVWVTAVRQ